MWTSVHQRGFPSGNSRERCFRETQIKQIPLHTQHKSKSRHLAAQVLIGTWKLGKMALCSRKPSLFQHRGQQLGTASEDKLWAFQAPEVALPFLRPSKPFSLQVLCNTSLPSWHENHRQYNLTSTHCFLKINIMLHL